MKATILVGDVREKLRELETSSIQTCVTSPPYWGLRDYGTGSWENGDPNCQHTISAYSDNLRGDNNVRPVSAHRGGNPNKCILCGADKIDNQLGLELTPEAYVANMVEVFREVKRILKDDGTLWLNLGDSYVGGKGASGQGSSEYQAERAERGESINQHYHNVGGKGITRGADNMKVMREIGLKPKDLVGIPWRVAFALQADGWYLRQDIIWAKPNPMPESVKDRCTKSHEYLFLLTKSPKYYFDNETIKEPAVVGYKSTEFIPNSQKDLMDKTEVKSAATSASVKNRNDNLIMTRNKRSVWNVATKPFKGAHFAVMPEALVEPCILAGSQAGDWVLDPFAGSGTVGVVALRHQRNFIGTELNPEYAQIARDRIGVDLFGGAE